MSKIIGIDLGTTNSAVAIMEGGEPKILENAEGNRTTPSIVAVSKTNERLVGLLAKRQSVTNPKNTIFSVKRLMGRKFTDPEVERDKAWLPYEIQAGATGGVEVKMGDKWYSPEEISAAILGKLKADAEARLGEKVEEAVITVPAYFDDSERQATKNAGEIAGLKVRRILNEPTAAALAYGLNKQKNEKIVVYDFGGGTFDISVLEVGDDTVEVKATGGDTHLGGDDFDKKIQEYFVGEYKKQEGIDISKDSLALQRLKEAAEKAKHELSTAVDTEINLPYISSDANGPKHFVMKLSRAKLESLVQEYIDRSIALTKETVTATGAERSGLPAFGYQRGHLGGRPDADARDGGCREEIVRQRSAPGHQSGRSGGAGRRGAGRHSPGRRERYFTFGCDAAFALDRDLWWRSDAHDPEEYDGADREDPGFFDGSRQPDIGRGAYHAGRTPDGGGQQNARTFHFGRHSAVAARPAPDRGDVRYRRERYFERLREGQGHR